MKRLVKNMKSTISTLTILQIKDFKENTQNWPNLTQNSISQTLLPCKNDLMVLKIGLIFSTGKKKLLNYFPVNLK